MEQYQVTINITVNPETGVIHEALATHSIETKAIHVLTVLAAQYEAVNQAVAEIVNTCYAPAEGTGHAERDNFVNSITMDQVMAKLYKKPVQGIEIINV